MPGRTTLLSLMAGLLCAVPVAAQPVRELQGHAAAVYAVAFRPDGRQLATGSFDQHIKIWDTATGRLVRTLTGHRAKVVALAWAPDGRRLASSDVAGEVRLWDMVVRKYRRLKGHEGCVYGIAFSSDDQYVVTCSQDESVKVWSTATGTLEQDWPATGCPQYAVAVAADGRTVAHGGIDGVINLRDRETGESIGTLSGHTDAVYSLAFTPERHLLSGSGDRSVRVWDVQRGEEIARCDGHKEAVYQVSCTPDCARLVSAATDGSAVVWDPDRAVPLESHRFPGRPLCAAFAPDGSRIAVGTGQARCFVMELPPHLR